MNSAMLSLALKRLRASVIRSLILTDIGVPSSSAAGADPGAEGVGDFISMQDGNSPEKTFSDYCHADVLPQKP